MSLKFLISMVLYLLFLGHIVLAYLIYIQSLGWLFAAPVLILMDIFIIPEAKKDWHL